jgi:hypothetical protein
MAAEIRFRVCSIMVSNMTSQVRSGVICNLVVALSRSGPGQLLLRGELRFYTTLPRICQIAT